jgi:hypothetical protein
MRNLVVDTSATSFTAIQTEQPKCSLRTHIGFVTQGPVRPRKPNPRRSYVMAGTDTGTVVGATKLREAVEQRHQQMQCIRPANPSTLDEQLQAPSCPRKPSCTPCLKRFPIRALMPPVLAGLTARNSRLN